jgi:hypothetical protein
VRTEIVTNGTGRVRSYDLDGKVLWEPKGIATRALGQLAASASPAGLVWVGRRSASGVDVFTPAAPVLKGTLQMSGRGQRVALLEDRVGVADGLELRDPELLARLRRDSSGPREPG